MVRPKPFRDAYTDSYFQFRNSVLKKGKLTWKPAVTGIPVRTVTFLQKKKKRTMLVGFPYLKVVPVGVHLSENFRARLSSRELTFFFFVHCTQSPLFLSPLSSDLPLAAAAPEAGFSSGFCKRRKDAADEFSAPRIGAPPLQVWCCLRSHFLNRISNVKREH